jgi:hypothetical protein
LEKKEYFLILYFILTQFCYRVFNKLGIKKGVKKTFWRESLSEKDYYATHGNTKQNADMWIEGIFQSYKHIDTIKETILQDFSFNLPLSDYIKNIYNDIDNSNSCAIHIRRGDYIGTSLDICNIDYYKNAIDYIKQHTSDVHFFFFSNDISWVKEQFNFTENACFVDTSKEQNGKIGDYYDLFLMAKAKHNIIPNSSFSWWAAYLNQNPDKMVLVPDQWIGDFVPIDDICPPEWVRIPL